MFDAIIFDLDGTLIDSNWVWPKVTKLYLEKHNLEVPKDLYILEGKSFTEIAKYFKEHFQIPQTLDEIKETWNSMGEEFYTTQMTLKEDVEEFLIAIQKKGLKIGVATSNSFEMTEKALNFLGVRWYFDEICTSCMVGSGKPHPDIYLETARRLQVDSKKCLVLEDMPNGVRAAKSAGMTTWVIKDTHKNIVLLKRLGDAYFETYKEVKRAFEKIEGLGEFANENG